MTFWLGFTDACLVWLNGMHKMPAKGLATLAPYLLVGSQMSTSPVFSGPLLTKAQAALGRASWARLQASVGRSFPRADRRFSFYTTGAQVFPAP